MKTAISSLALICALSLSGFASAEDKMATPATGDAMATDAMAPNAMATDAMSPADVLVACLVKAGALTDMAEKDKATKACNDAQAMAGDAMAPATDAMAPAADAMAPAADAMAPAK
jgi:pentapeptide MXKDX repeat protein